ncbi:MAG: urea ABC transporter substrate-binding protein [Verrucomicrobia bacterium]|nr:urea ABC transporter substrate-binding protein [Verrucomicrobiota bacterium]NBU10461.1 urea ABC transporter substrate-binding protein [Pseudomonadota bacterium]NDA65227.1 urea ABC transporter substrate-binding protein [Verrucomicrobiota bacterium]NDB74136.1 urea ABC transporter substrate-binding protein [Verrucomicrobiota bacterium]NDD36901.1 urea ABC transporter substrate-binding protein [Verrucomicrobiota bacterium]
MKSTLVSNLLCGAAAAALSFSAMAADTVKVGVLHSLSGTMAISETSLKDVLLFTFDEINKAGGIKVGGKKVLIEPVVVDPASNWPLFAEKAEQLLVKDKVSVVFGCWTSVSRKSCLPVFERNNGLLFYPVQYEGEELSKNIFYTAEAVNQQAVPAVDYMLGEGKKKFFLLGSDYVYPRTTNKILKQYLKSKGIPDSDIEEIYTPFGHTDYQTIVASVKKFAAGGKACIISTLNGDTNVPFFKEFANAGLTSENCPVVSFSISEDEFRGLPAKQLVGHLGCWTYFMSIKSPENTKFVGDFMKWIKAPVVTGVDYKVTGIDAKGRVTCSPMNLSRIGVYLWKQAVEKAGTFEVDAVRTALIGQKFKAPTGEVTMQENHHLINPVFIGETLATGQFKIIKSLGAVAGEPFSEKFLTKK